MPLLPLFYLCPHFTCVCAGCTEAVCPFLPMLLLPLLLGGNTLLLEACFLQFYSDLLDVTTEHLKEKYTTGCTLALDQTIFAYLGLSLTVLGNAIPIP